MINFFVSLNIDSHLSLSILYSTFLGTDSFFQIFFQTDSFFQIITGIKNLILHIIKCR